jgi:hypothetical protein
VASAPIRRLRSRQPEAPCEVLNIHQWVQKADFEREIAENIIALDETAIKVKHNRF